MVAGLGGKQLVAAKCRNARPGTEGVASGSPDTRRTLMIDNNLKKLDMSLLTLTDAEIDQLLGMPKQVQNPGSRERKEGKHLRKDFRVQSHDEKYEFVLFTRQSTVIHNGFSAGLRWCSKTGEDVILVRCNGADHPHVNALERDAFDSQFHIHRATAKYISAGKRSEGRADPTNRFRTLSGALHEIVRIGNISGLSTQPDEADLFE